jgi:uncharacterized RDD family membrane protein YckC
MDRVEPLDRSVRFKEKDMQDKLVILASPKRRYLGQFIDILVTWAVFLGCLFTANELSIQQDYAGIISVFVAAMYFVFSDALPKGQTLGKKFLNISVIDKRTGKYCTLWQSFLRNMFTPILGAIDAVFILSKKRQRIGDMMANTIVVKNN